MKKLSTILFLLIPVVLFGQYDLKRTGIPYRKGNKWGYAHYNTKAVLVAPEYDSVSYLVGFLNDIPKVYKDHKMGLVDDTGRVIIPPTASYNYIDMFLNEDNKNLAWIAGYYGGSKQLYNLNGTRLLDTLYQEIFLVNDTLVLFANNYLYGIYDIKNKKERIKPVYSLYEINSDCTKKEYRRFSLERIIFKDNANKTYRIDSCLKLIPFSINQDCLNQDYIYGRESEMFGPGLYFDMQEYNNEGKQTSNKTYTTTQGNKYVLTDKYYKQYQLIKNNKSNRFGLIENTDQNIQVVRLEPVYSDVSLFTYKKMNVFAMIKKDGKTGVYDLSALKEIAQPMYDSIQFDYNKNDFYNKEEMIIYKNGKLGRIEFKKESRFSSIETKIIQPEYDMMIHKDQYLIKSKNFYFVKKNNVYYYIANDGTVYYDATQ
ncbi:MAG: WG repeat-containing protein [Chitinophagales bacterium]